MTRTLTTIFTAVLLLLGVQKSNAQNIQVLYDTERDCVTSTVEMFRPDNYGSTFFFVDMDYTPKVQGAYWEISRELCFWQNSKYSWLSLHLEFDGGLNNAAGSFNNAWLTGLTYSGHSKDFSKTWSISAMYKLIPDTKDVNGKDQQQLIHKRIGKPKLMMSSFNVCATPITIGMKINVRMFLDWKMKWLAMNIAVNVPIKVM